ncbi:hypothetical protein [Bradyrhizobium sp. SYSU BS000235]|uniref:hypothetical protein n=1 Tax=Bradyrhizobium sp. SYSU BS000235 TaxID=3411332 RepID=UPI003C756C5E
MTSGSRCSPIPISRDQERASSLYDAGDVVSVVVEVGALNPDLGVLKHRQRTVRGQWFRLCNLLRQPCELEEGGSALSARVGEANRLTKADLLRKYGPKFGIGAPPAAIADAATKPRQSMTVEQITAHYAAHGLGFKPKPKRDDDRYEGVTSDDGEAA